MFLWCLYVGMIECCWPTALLNSNSGMKLPALEVYIHVAVL